MVPVRYCVVAEQVATCNHHLCQRQLPAATPLLEVTTPAGSPTRCTGGKEAMGLLLGDHRAELIGEKCCTFALP